MDFWSKFSIFQLFHGSIRLALKTFQHQTSLDLMMFDLGDAVGFMAVSEEQACLTHSSLAVEKVEAGMMEEFSCGCRVR